MYIKSFYKTLRYRHYKKCFDTYSNQKDYCMGLVGGDKATGYLQYDCIECPFLRLNYEEIEK